METSEIWKDIPWYEGSYQVSDLWRVKCLIKKSKVEKILKPMRDTSGYTQVALYKNKIRYYRTIHRLVCLAFIWESLLQVNHKNMVKSDNRLINLECVTRSENALHAFRTIKPKKSLKRRVTCIDTGHVYNSIREASIITGFTRTWIVRCCNGILKTYKSMRWEFI